LAITNRQRLGDLLVQTGVITPDQLNEALEEQKRTGQRLGTILVKHGFFSEHNLIEVLEFQLGIPHVVLSKRSIEPDVLAIVPENLVKKYKVFPVEKLQNRLILGMLDPTDIFALDDLRLNLNTEIQPVIITEEDLNQAINKYYGISTSVKEVFKDLDIEIEEVTDEEAADSVQTMIDEAPIVRLVNLVITQAVKERASDIHIEPNEREVAIRYRVDGSLKQVMTSPKNTQLAIISRIKIMSGMNIAEKRIPQDGRIQMKVDKMPIDLRVSTIPLIFGEKIVMRILYKGNIMVKMEKLGFLPDTLEKFRQVYNQPHGIILVTGPTGSGKSTTLSAVLNELNSPEDNIMTVEDPVEYQIAGVNQVQVNIKAGLNFASALRSFLRQDPDIIMVGEIRDQETAQIATQAALTGHLVLSTLHTNDAPGSIARLIDMGIEPFMVASTVAAVLAQRLIRGVCPDCKTAYRLQPDDYYYKVVTDALGDFPPDRLVFYHGKGCRQCNNTGYSKRLAIHEVFMMNPELRSLVVQNVPSGVLKEAAMRTGMRTLFQDGLVKALEGKTTVEEVVKAAYTSE
jgi:type IV pilus assembly protein PilB